MLRTSTHSTQYRLRSHRLPIPRTRSYLCHFNTLSIMASLYEPTRARMSRVIFNAVGLCLVLGTLYLFDSLLDPHPSHNRTRCARPNAP